MPLFSMTCSCGHAQSVEAANREEAIMLLQLALTQDDLDEHYRSIHSPAETAPALVTFYAMIRHLVAAVGE